METTVKPIVVIYLPENFNIGNNSGSAATELMTILNNNYGWEKESKYAVNNYWKDYLWFVFNDYELSIPRFEVFYPKDFTEIQFNELKDLVENKLKEIAA